MTEALANAFTTAVGAGGITAAATTLPVNNAAPLQLQQLRQSFSIVVNAGYATQEVMEVTAGQDGTAWTVTRASEPINGVQTAFQHFAGEPVQQVLTQASLYNFASLADRQYQFRAHVAGTPTMASSDQVLPVDTVDFDPYGSFDAPNHAYIVPVKGIYRWGGGFRVSNNGTFNVGLGLYVNGGLTYVGGTQQAGTAYGGVRTTEKGRFNKGDSLQLDVWQNSGFTAPYLNDFGGSGNFFEVELLGRLPDNLIPIRDADLEDGIGSWVPQGTGYTVAVSTAWAYTGTHSLALTCGAASGGYAINGKNQGGAGFLLSASTTYPYNFWAMAGTNGRAMLAGLACYDSGNNWISNQTFAYTDSTTPTKYSGSFTTPAGTVRAILFHQVNATPTSGEVHYTDTMTLG